MSVAFGQLLAVVSKTFHFSKMPPVYSLQNTINAFFESFAPVTRAQCDEFAVSLFGEPINPVPIQGMFSYTVMAGPTQSTIIQFRDPKSDLNTTILDLACDVHEDLVATCTAQGELGQPPKLSVYSMAKLPGIAYIQARSQHMHSLEVASVASPQHSNTVTDLAIYFAQAWKRKQIIPPKQKQAIHDDYHARLTLLSQTLPSQFSNNCKRAIEGLSSLFAPDYPLVLNHGDLCEMNILVDLTTGHLTGIIDWVEAKILPFGVSLWGPENTFGWMDSQGWHHFGCRDALEELFWRTFEEHVGKLSNSQKEAIQVSRLIGCFIRYGFVWADENIY